MRFRQPEPAAHTGTANSQRLSKKAEPGMRAWNVKNQADEPRLLPHALPNWSRPAVTASNAKRHLASSSPTQLAVCLFAVRA